MEDVEKRLKNLEERLRIEEKRRELRELEAAANKPGFWDDWQAAQKVMKKIAGFQEIIEKVERIKELINKSKELKELVNGQEEKGGAVKLLDELEEQVYLSGKYDDRGAVFSIQAGAGGVEAQDWAEMLERMYLKFFEKKGWEAREIDKSFGEEAGIKKAVLTVEGEMVYGLLKFEAGTHRLVRLSPFNADHLRQTSFAKIEVLPDLGETREVEIEESDLEWDFFRSSGPGGQNVNKVSTAVRVKHGPSGLVVTAQSQRSQQQNRDQALKILRAKLWEIEFKKRDEEESELGGGSQGSWGTQIRNYVLHPYKMVKDLRTGEETSEVEKVLNGDLDQFIEAEIRKLNVVD